MLSRDAALEVARNSPRVARLLATAIVTGARLRLSIRISQSEGASLARDYLPADALEKIRENRERPEFRSLPGDYRDLGGVSRTIIDGVRQSTVRELSGERSGFGAWFDRLTIRARAWNAAKKITTDLQDRAASHERTLTDTVRHASEIDDLLEDLRRQNDDRIRCLQLREEYARKIDEIRLSELAHDEAIAALDAVINYHLALLVNDAPFRPADRDE
jgi:hypothetical protein